VVRRAVPSNHPADRLRGVDPSACFLEELYATPRAVSQARMWSCVSLLDRSDWVHKYAKPSWPVHYAGNRKLGERFKTKPDVYAFMSQYRGVLSPSYFKLNGAGWYRSRFLEAAHLGC